MMSSSIFIIISSLSVIAYLVWRNSKLKDALFKTENELSLTKQSLEQRKCEEDLLVSFSSELKTYSQEMLNNLYEKTEEHLKNKVDNKVTSLNNVISPLKEHLDAFKTKIEDFEKTRAQDKGSLETQIKHLLHSEENLKKETSNLTQVLKSSTSRGRWGEIQLEKILELSGMLKYCDYNAQKKINTSSLNFSKPDITINLPDNKYIIVDAKFPFPESYFTSQEPDFQDLTSKIKEHIKSLNKKSYGKELSGSPDFVILFLPIERLFSDALKYDPELIEFSSKNNVCLASPITLLAVLKTTAYAWKQENIKGKMEDIGKWGQNVYSKIATMVSHLSKIGYHLSNAVSSYNETLGSIDKSVLSAAKKFEDFDILSENDKKIPQLKDIEILPKNIKSSYINSQDGESNSLSEQ